MEELVAELIPVPIVHVGAEVAEPLLPEPQPQGRKGQQMAQPGEEVSVEERES